MSVLGQVAPPPPGSAGFPSSYPYAFSAPMPSALLRPLQQYLNSMGSPRSKSRGREFSLIDLEAVKLTGRKQAKAGQRERLSERTPRCIPGGCDSLSSQETNCERLAEPKRPTPSWTDWVTNLLRYGSDPSRRYPRGVGILPAPVGPDNGLHGRDQDGSGNQYCPAWAVGEPAQLRAHRGVKSANVKPALIDLDAEMQTGRKQAAMAVQRERLSEQAPARVMRQSDLQGIQPGEPGRDDQARHQASNNNASSPSLVSCLKSNQAPRWPISMLCTLRVPSYSLSESLGALRCKIRNGKPALIEGNPEKDRKRNA